MPQGINHHLLMVEGNEGRKYKKLMVGIILRLNLLLEGNYLIG